MTKQQYKKLLQRPEWKKRRLTILKRDGFKCVKCNSKGPLHVHHKYYIEDSVPWAVPNSALVTLCKWCHEKEHEGKDISSFIRRKKQKHKRYKNQTKQVKKK